MDHHQHQAMSDAMDTDVAATSRESGPAAGPSQGAAAQAQALESVRSLLAMARQLVDQDKPSVALQAVMTAMRSVGGENAMLQTLQRARELYRNNLRANAAADELASLFAECAIAEAHPLTSNQLLHQPQPPQPPQSQLPQPPDAGGIPAMLLNTTNDSSILATSGRKQVMLDAFSDGSSFICLQCGGLVSNVRKDEHLAYWCGDR